MIHPAAEILARSKTSHIKSYIKTLESNLAEARTWLTTRKIEKELKRVQKKDRNGKELRGCKPPTDL